MADGIMDYGEELPSTVAPYSERYIQSALKGREAQLAPARRQAMQELQQEYASRGLSESGLAGFAQAQADQNYLNSLADYRNQLGLQGAQLGEQNRQRMEQRGWEVEDRDLRYKMLLDAENRQRAAAKQAQDAALWGNIMGGVGSVVGGIYGGPMGAAAGGAAGRAITSGSGNDANARLAALQSEIDALGSDEPMDDYQYPSWRGTLSLQ